MSLKIGVDVGGTFTDIAVWSVDGTLETFKTLSTPGDPSEGVLAGLGAVAESRGLTLTQLAESIEVIVHGTTVTTNAALTRSGAKTGLITTRGVRDALEMRRGIRERQYDNHYRNAEPVVPRYLRCAVPGRLDYAGRELEPLSLEALRDCVELFTREGVEAVAICFMNSFANPSHERTALEFVQSELPGAYVSASVNLLPTIRFYNRVSTTTLDAYVGPVFRGYMDKLTGRLGDLGCRGTLLIMQSNGGVALPAVVRDRAATTLLSGPAGAPRAAATYAASGDDSGDCIVVDMGGTSFDTSLVRDGEAAVENEGQLGRIRIALPMLSIATIGAGGGSLGWINKGGLLRMGPSSAGADPGPACYRRGGTKPTCTDANLVLGYLDAQSFAGGQLPLCLESAQRAIGEHVASSLGLSVEEAAAGMCRVINANMAHGVREITVARGVDPRELSMVVAGGAAGLHACMIAAELEIPRLLIPSTASVLCATGMLMSNLQHDYVSSYVCRLRDLDSERMCTLVSRMIATGQSELEREGMSMERIEHRVFLDLRYVRQYHELSVAVPPKALEGEGIGPVIRKFHREHNRLYGYDLELQGTDLELINIRVRSIGRTDKPVLPRIGHGTGDPDHARTGARRAFVPESGRFGELPVYNGHALLAGDHIVGPALIERIDTTLLVTEGFAATVDVFGTCELAARDRDLKSEWRRPMGADPIGPTGA